MTQIFMGITQSQVKVKYQNSVSQKKSASKKSNK